MIQSNGKSSEVCCGLERKRLKTLIVGGVCVKLEQLDGFMRSRFT